MPPQHVPTLPPSSYFNMCMPGLPVADAIEVGGMLLQKGHSREQDGLRFSQLPLDGARSAYDWAKPSVQVSEPRP